MVPALKLFALPPLCLLLLAACGWLVLRRYPRVGKGSMWFSLLTFVMLCLPVTSTWLMGTLQGESALSPTSPPPAADAIVILSAGMNRDAPEYGGAAVGRFTLERLRYGARLHRRCQLPVLVSGGPIEAGAPTVAQLMAQALEDDWGIETRWIEGRSFTTYDNARLSHILLEPVGALRILLVTHAWHMPRARQAFEKRGFEVIAAPTGFRHAGPLDLRSFLPSGHAFYNSTLAVHEWVGWLWYALR